MELINRDVAKQLYIQMLNVAIVIIAVSLILLQASILFRNKPIDVKITPYKADIIAAEYVKNNALEQWGVNTELFRDPSLNWHIDTKGLSTIGVTDISGKRITELVYPIEFTLDNEEKEPFFTLYVDANTGDVRGSRP